MNPYVAAARTLLRWVGAAFITYEAAGIVEEVGDKFPDADVIIQAPGGGPGMDAGGPYGLTRAGVLGTVIVAATVAYGMSRIGRKLGL